MAGQHVELERKRIQQGAAKLTNDYVMNSILNQILYYCSLQI